MVDSQQDNSRDDGRDGELGVDEQQLGLQVAGAEDQQGGAGDDGVQQSDQQEEDAEEDQAAGESQAGPETSGAAGQGPFNPKLLERVKDLEKLVRDIMAEKLSKPRGSHFHGGSSLGLQILLSFVELIMR
jgi:hypothetical protein